MGWRGLKERIFYEPVERYTWSAAHHDDEMKSGPNILLIFTGYIVQACRYVPPISHFFLFSFFFFLVLSIRNALAHTYTHGREVMCHAGEKRS